MTGETYVLLSSAVTFGVPLVLAVLQLRGLGPSARGGEEPPPPPVIAPLPRPLPDCLLPRPVARPAATRVRILEDA
ncbi:hypothetical protein [Glacieibacterium frigidum]|uniref:Uncharacterized protein n=1 Tax=Glacieibacterium frigidum TaxID=2593303 RepID=A0A552U7X0_9SPHN|nr:hypothetical protein [Glacieibacterium frigidum]TRW14314.1 hypothetical protein FMM06_11415 [Glacieibacterium frigidum]